MWYLFMKLVQYNVYFVSTAGTDGPVLEHQDISCHNAEYTHMFPGVLGLTHWGQDKMAAIF